MDGGDFLRATVEMTIPNASNPCLMVWDFQLDPTNDPIDLTDMGLDIVDALIARCYTPLLGRMTSQLTGIGVSLRNLGDITDGFDASGVLFTGSNPSAMLPPFITYSIELLKGNFAMRNGRKAYPGATVDNCDSDGLVTDSAQAAFADVTDVWASTAMVVEGTVDATFFPRIIRVPATPNTNPTVFSNIIGYGLVKFGSQNTRK
jgi:hypothetical protein